MIRTASLREAHRARPPGSAGHQPARRARSRPSGAAPAVGRGGTFALLVSLLSVLCLTGLVMVLSASSILSLHRFGSPWHYFIRQILWLAVGSAGFVVALRVDHRTWRRAAPAAMYVSIGLLFAVLVPGIGVRSSGASRWLGTASFQIQ